MKKYILLIGFIMITTPALGTTVDGRTEKGPVGRAFSVMGRGLLNVVGLPAEISSTMIRETETHKWLWPVTGVPRAINNLFVRSASAVNDVFFLPFSTPFSNDISPWTEPMGLPDYPWQVNEG